MTLTLPDWLPLLLTIPGWLCIAIGICPDRWWRILALVLGMAMVAAGGATHDGIAPLPPGPAPVPAPVGVFGDRVRQSFGGTKAEGQIVAALFQQSADQIAFDGTRATPKIKNLNTLGQWWAEVQRNRYLAEVTPLNKFQPTALVVTDELRQRGVDVTKNAALDPGMRAAVASVFAEAGAALR